MRKHLCKCLICKTARDLSLIMESPARKLAFRNLAIAFPPVAEFDCPMTLINHLHRRDLDTNQLKAADRALGFLIRGYAAAPADPIFSELIVLAFFPALHSTYLGICRGFRNLLPEDVAQEILTTFFEVCRLPSIQTLNGHISVTLYRTLRTTLLRWAFKQTREVCNHERLESLDEDALEQLADGNFERVRELRDLLDDCCRIGALSDEDYDLLVKVKLEGFKAKELSLNGGPSPMAIHHRVQRIMNRLRQKAPR